MKLLKNFLTENLCTHMHMCTNTHMSSWHSGNFNEAVIASSASGNHLVFLWFSIATLLSINIFVINVQCYHQVSLQLIILSICIAMLPF